MRPQNSSLFLVKNPSIGRGNHRLSPTAESTQANRHTQQLRAELLEREQFYEHNSYSYYTELFIRRLVSKAQSQHHYLRKYNLKTLVSSVVNRLFLNELELIFFNYVLTETGWNIHEDVVVRGAIQVRQQPSAAEEVQSLAEYRQLILYLYLSAFAAKYYLNPPEQSQLFLCAIGINISNFYTIFESWVRNKADSILTINPCRLNGLFKQMVTKSNEQGELLDYNRLVEQLLIISPSYKINEMDTKPQIHNHSKAQSLRPIQHIQMPVLSPQPAAEPKKKIKLNFAQKQQDVNSHMNPIFQSINFNDVQKQRDKVANISKQSSSKSKDQSGLFAIPEDYSELSAFRFRPNSNRRSDMASKLNLQRSSYYQFP